MKNKPTQVVFPPTDRDKIDAARAVTGETFSAFVRRAALFLVHQEKNNLPRPEDAQPVPVVEVMK